MPNNFQFNLHWNEPNPYTLQTSRPAASADGSQNQQALKAFGFLGSGMLDAVRYVELEMLDAFRYPLPASWSDA